MIRLSMVFWLAALAVAAIFLYELKHRVQDLEEQLAEVHGEILRDQEAIQVLKAEWSYLNQPSRIAELADRYLDLKPIEASQIASFQEVPEAPVPEPAPQTQEAAAPAAEPQQKDSIGNLIEAVVEQPAAPSESATAQETESRQASAQTQAPAPTPVNPVTGEPLPVTRQNTAAQPAGGGVGQPVQLFRTGATQ